MCGLWCEISSKPQTDQTCIWTDRQNRCFINFSALQVFSNLHLSQHQATEQAGLDSFRVHSPQSGPINFQEHPHHINTYTMLNSLKKPAAASSTAAPKKTMTPAERAEAVAAAVAAAQAAQAAKKAATAPKSTPTSAAKTNGKDSKDNKDTSKDTKAAAAAATNGEAKEDGEAGADDKDEEEEDKEAEKGQSGEAKAAMKNMTGYQQETEREGVDSDKLEKVRFFFVVWVMYSFHVGNGEEKLRLEGHGAVGV